MKETYGLIFISLIYSKLNIKSIIELYRVGIFQIFHNINHAQSCVSSS